MTKPTHRHLEEVTTTSILEEENQTDRNKPFPQPLRASGGKASLHSRARGGSAVGERVRLLDFVELAGTAEETIKVLKKTRMYLIPRNWVRCVRNWKG